MRRRVSTPNLQPSQRKPPSVRTLDPAVRTGEIRTCANRYLGQTLHARGPATGNRLSSSSRNPDITVDPQRRDLDCQLTPAARRQLVDHGPVGSRLRADRLATVELVVATLAFGRPIGRAVANGPAAVDGRLFSGRERCWSVVAS